MTSFPRDERRERELQARKVMPLIGPLLDAWEAIPNDEMTALVVAAPYFHSAMRKLVSFNAADAE